MNALAHPLTNPLADISMRQTFCWSTRLDGGRLAGQRGGQPSAIWGPRAGRPQGDGFLSLVPREAGESLRSSVCRVTSKNSGLSPIHRPYYNHYLFLSI
jgi:hypothetical protein